MESKRHKQNYDHKVRCTQLTVGDLVLLKRMAFKGTHKIQDHWEDIIYCVEGQPYAELPVFRTAPIAGEGKVKVVHWNLLLPFGGNIEGGPENKEVNKMSNDLWIVCWHSLMMVGQRLRLCWQILNLSVRVMQSIYSVYKLWKSQIIGIKPYKDG